MIVLVAGMPRAGSMLTYNIVRELYKALGYMVLPESIPKDEKELLPLVLAMPPRDKTVYCIKTHCGIRPEALSGKDVKLINNIRDVRDAALSYKRFTKADFPTVLQQVSSMIEVADFYKDNFGLMRLEVRYDDLEKDLILVINRISKYLGLSVPGDVVKNIAIRLDKKSVKKKLDKLSSAINPKTGEVKDDSYEAVPNFDGTYRAFDKSSSFQTNHITSLGKPGWRETFNDEEIGLLSKMVDGWLVENGFS